VANKNIVESQLLKAVLVEKLRFLLFYNDSLELKLQTYVTFKPKI
jgi:hypothetical protein